MEIFKYLIAGGVNTLIGYGIFLCLISVFEVDPKTANPISYFLCLIIAFNFNKKIFPSTSIKSSKIAHKFIIAFGISFSLNFLVLYFFLHVLRVPPQLSQIPAMASYTLFFYFLNKYYVFSKSII
jgi:putative flippase GtrA